MEIKNYYIICDRSLYYTIDNQKMYSELIHDNIIIETPKGTKADIFILQLAQEKAAYIISNDWFKDYYGFYDKYLIKSKRISFKIIDRDIFFDKLIKSIS